MLSTACEYTQVFNFETVNALISSQNLLPLLWSFVVLFMVWGGW